MKVESYPLHSFEEGRKDVHSIQVPKGSKFLGAKILHDGIYVWYTVPEIIIEEKQEEKFAILSPDQSIPDDAEFITILDTIVESPQGQGILIFPIFKLK